MIPYIEASIAASNPSALREPNSITPTFFGVASIILLAPVACSIAPLIIERIAVSIIWASIIGALTVNIGSDVFNEFYIVGRDNDGNCRDDPNLNNYLYFSDKPILFNQNYSYSCNLNTKNIGDTTLFQKLKAINKIAKYGNSHYSKLEDENFWLKINNERLSASNALIKMNIYLGTRKIGIHSYKYIYKVILKSIESSKNNTLSLDINFYDLDKKQDFKEKPRTPQFIPSMPADLLDPLIYSKVDK